MIQSVVDMDADVISMECSLVWNCSMRFTGSAIPMRLARVYMTFILRASRRKNKLKICFTRHWKCSHRSNCGSIPTAA
jgi:hypothetical protein